jgi:hypothetical protein
VGLLVGKELGDDKENNNLFLDDVDFEKKYDSCEHRAEQQKKRGLANSHLRCAATGTVQHKRASGRSLVSTADAMMFSVVQVAVS